MRWDPLFIQHIVSILAQNTKNEEITESKRLEKNVRKLGHKWKLSIKLRSNNLYEQFTVFLMESLGNKRHKLYITSKIKEYCIHKKITKTCLNVTSM